MISATSAVRIFSDIHDPERWIVDSHEVSNG
jgi:hypothetical protein